MTASTNKPQISPQEIKLETFMAEVLYNPINGYYAQNDVLGKEQDFITAPALSPLFSHCLAQWCLDQWINFGQPTPLNLIELGAGQGIMLRDMLTAFRKVPDFYRRLNIYVAEKSERLKSVQRKNLKEHNNIHWIENLDEIKTGYSILVANEFFDALPIQYYRQHDNTVEEAVIINQQTIKWRKTSIPLPPSPHSIFLSSTAYEFFVDQIAALFNRTGGVGLIIDYGSDNPGFTLQAIKNHQKIGLFDHLGKADLTHHVDFQYLIKLFKDRRINILGPQQQSDFLLDLGLSERLESLRKQVQPHIFAQHALAAYRLTSASEMGELFKVIAIQGNIHAP